MTELQASSQEAVRLEGARNVFDSYIELKAGEKVLFLTDEDSFNTNRSLIDIFQKELKRRGNEFAEFKASDDMSEGKILKAIDGYAFIWQSWGMDESDVDFYKIAGKISSTGQRLIFAPGTDTKSLDSGGPLSVPKEVLNDRLSRIESKLRGATGLHIRTAYGTDLKVALRPTDRRWFKEDGVLKAGKWGNLPPGEVFTTPDENEVEGTLVLPVLQDEVATDQGVDEFVFLTIRDGKIAKIDGGRSAEKLRKYLEKASKSEPYPKNVVQCSEIAVGANPLAPTVVTKPEGTWRSKTNPTLSTEKRLGTIHLAFGSAKHGEEGTEGGTEAETHLDFVIPRHTLTLTAFYNDSDWRLQKNGTNLIDNGGWNFLS